MSAAQIKKKALPKSLSMKNLVLYVYLLSEGQAIVGATTKWIESIYSTPE